MRPTTANAKDLVRTWPKLERLCPTCNCRHRCRSVPHQFYIRPDQRFYPRHWTLHWDTRSKTVQATVTRIQRGEKPGTLGAAAGQGLSEHVRYTHRYIHSLPSLSDTSYVYQGRITVRDVEDIQTMSGRGEVVRDRIFR